MSTPKEPAKRATPQIMRSPLTGNWYVVTRFRSDGSAQTKYDVTDQVNAIIQSALRLAKEGTSA